ncbi:T9SS type A sorting domain-containing protein, partial [Candidatus Latescibacterota bacterium]
VVIGRKIHFKAELFDSTGVKDETAVILWSVEGDIGEIEDNLDKNSQFTATTIGEGFVVATCGELIARAAVTVVPEPGLVITPLDAFVGIGDSIQYKAFALDELGDTLRVDVEWDVTAEIGEIDLDGLFIAVGAGEGIVSATADTLSAEVLVTVGIEPYIAILPDSAVVSPGDSIQYTATVFDALGDTLDVAVVWEIDSEIGEIDAEGLFIATALGEGIITATYDSLTAETIVTVSIEPHIVISSETTAVRREETIQFIATVFDELGNILDIPVEWLTTGNIGEIDENGLFTAIEPGQGLVIATADTLTAEVFVTVNIDPYLVIIPDSTAASLGDSIVVSLGDTIQFTAKVYDALGDTLEIEEILWEAADDIGEMDEYGLFIATAPGIGFIKATGITAEPDTLVAETTISVTIEPYISISPDSINVNLDSQIIFTATVFDALGDTLDVEVEWSTTDNDIGKIDKDGIFTAKKAGETLVIASADTLTAEAKVIVVEKIVIPLSALEGEGLVLVAFPYPLQFLNGMKLFFPIGSIPEGFVVHISLPGFAKVDDELNKVLYFGNIITAVSFQVSVNGEFISPFNFDIPIEVSIPFDIDGLAELGLTPYDLTMLFVTSEGEFETEGISDLFVDMDLNILTGKVAHFSDIAVVPKSITAGIDEEDRPVGYSLSQNFPNPFNPVTTISYAIPSTSHVSLTIYSILGQSVKTLVEEEKIPGYYNVIWDGRNENGGIVSSGLYIYQIQAGNFRQSKKLMFMK